MISALYETRPKSSAGRWPSSRALKKTIRWQRKKKDVGGSPLPQTEHFTSRTFHSRSKSNHQGCKKFLHLMIFKCCSYRERKATPASLLMALHRSRGRLFNGLGSSRPFTNQLNLKCFTTWTQRKMLILEARIVSGHKCCEQHSRDGAQWWMMQMPPGGHKGTCTFWKFQLEENAFIPATSVNSRVKMSRAEFNSSPILANL